MLHFTHFQLQTIGSALQTKCWTAFGSCTPLKVQLSSQIGEQINQITALPQTVALYGSRLIIIGLTSPAVNCSTQSAKYRKYLGTSNEPSQICLWIKRITVDFKQTHAFRIQLSFKIYLKNRFEHQICCSCTDTR